MGTSESIRTANETLVGYTRKKLDDVVETINLLKEEDFPQKHSGYALDLLEHKFQQRLSLLDKTSASNDPTVIHRVCKEATETIDQYLPLIGFVARSMHIRNAFELHGPVFDLVKNALGEDAKLILSSEWEFSPFTFILPSLEDRRFVMIGLPASESANALIIPLAGHELGHSIWAKAQLERKYLQLLVDALVKVFAETHYEKLKQVIGEYEKDRENIISLRPWQLAYGWAIQQCEEIFCDLIGLMTFGRSYLYAFTFLLAPGPAQERKAGVYPTAHDRVDILCRAGKELGISVEEDILLQFESTPTDDVSDGNWGDVGKLMLQATDHACRELVNELLSDARCYCKDHKLSYGGDAEVARIAAAFLKLVPGSGVKNLADIINAGWQVCIQHRFESSTTAFGELKQQKKDFADVVLNDLMLKTVEVFDIQQRQAAA